MPRKVLIFCTILACLAVTGCPKYSPETVAGIKAALDAAKSLYSTFGGEYDPEAMKPVKARLDALVALQETRGKANAIQAKACGKFLELFVTACRQRETGQPWSPAMIDASTENLETVANICIQIEEGRKQ